MKLLIPLSAIILLIFSITPALAQSPLTATVDRASLTTDDTLVLTVSVSADGQPRLPDLSGFNLVGSNTSSQISIINGAMSAQVAYNYYLQPTQTGTLTIGPVTLTVDGQSYSTQPITVQVTQGTGRPAQARPSLPAMPSLPNLGSFFQNSPFGSPGQSPATGDDQNAFVAAEVSNPTPYLGEQITYTFRFYRAPDFVDFFDQPHFEPPAFSGFWSENQEEEKRYQAQTGGRLYEVTELNTILTPSKTGALTIEPARLTLPGSFFRSGAMLETEPVLVNVRPLPANAPQSFTGAVGQFEIEASVDASQSKVNEPVTWRVVLRGQGNLETLADPHWPELVGWRSYDSQASTRSQAQNGQMVGERVYERLLLPQAAGDYTIPALEYSYFDPAAGQYQTIATDPIAVSVAPGDDPVASLPLPAPEPDPPAGPTAAMNVRALLPAPDQLAASRPPITASPLYWLAWGIPLVGLLGNLAWQRRQKFRANNAAWVRSSQAYKKARQSLAAARQESGDVYSAAGQILLTYLSDKLGQPVLGLTQTALAELLGGKALSPTLVERVQHCLAQTELGRFAPEAGQPDHAQRLLDEIEQLLQDLEQALV